MTTPRLCLSIREIQGEDWEFADCFLVTLTNITGFKLGDQFSCLVGGDLLDPVGPIIGMNHEKGQLLVLNLPCLAA